MLRDVLIVLSGFVAGTLSGSLGIGGGVVMVPMLTVGFGLSERLAQGTSLAAIVPISLVGAWTHLREGNVLLRPAIWMAAAGAPLALAGGLLAQRVPAALLTHAFGVLVILAAYQIWPLWKPRLHRR
jgi:uncharacterized membrane protein YfcA